MSSQIASITLKTAFFLLFLASSGHATQVENYSDIYANNPYLSTVTARLLKARQTQPRDTQLVCLDGRSETPIIGNVADLPVSFYGQRTPAPLVFVIPGLGGTSSDGQAIYLGENLFSLGYSVVILPSPFSWKFVLSQSSTGIPGYSPADAEDLFRVMKTSVRQLSQNYGIEATSYALVGYSLGAVEAAFVRQLDLRSHEFNFTRVALINPPLDLSYASQVIDEMNEIGNQWTPEQRSLIWGKVLTMGPKMLARDINDPTYFMGLDSTPLSNSAIARYLIGNSFRSSLADMIFASQQVNDLGILKTSASRLQRNARQAEAARISFVNYTKQFVFPFWSAHLGVNLTYQELAARGDLGVIENDLINDSAVYLLHNQDDFLTLPEQTIRLDQKLGKRSYLFPAGGHVGNLWNPAHLAAIREIFAR